MTLEEKILTALASARTPMSGYEISLLIEFRGITNLYRALDRLEADRKVVADRFERPHPQPPRIEYSLL